MSEIPEQPEGKTSPQDVDLEAQLDELLHQLEEVDPQTVPADLRKNKPAEPVTTEPVTTEPVAAESVNAEPVNAESATDEPVAAEASAEESQPQASAEPVTEPADTEVVETQTLARETDTADDAGADTPASANTASQGIDLDAIASMAADLLDQQIDATIESAVEDSEFKETSTPDEPTDSTSAQASEPAAVEEAKPKPIVPMDEDDLASQIQGLLNEVQDKGVDAIPDQEPAAQASEQDPQTTEAGEAAAEPESDEPAEAVEQAPAVVSAVEATDAQSSAEAVTVPIDQIDAMLAESAQQAIEHGPAPTTDIPPGTDELLAAQAEAEQEAQARAKAERDAAELPGAQEAEPKPAAPVSESVAAEPQPVQAPGASAEDVAKELDEDASPAPADNDPAQPVPAEPMAVDVPQAGGVVIKAGGLKKAERVLLKLCGKINRPLNRLSPEMRDTVGYAGVVTTALALFMVLYGVLF